MITESIMTTRHLYQLRLPCLLSLVYFAGTTLATEMSAGGPQTLTATFVHPQSKNCMRHHLLRAITTRVMPKGLQLAPESDVHVPMLFFLRGAG